METIKHSLAEKITKNTKHWIRSFVIQFNLCPFAKRVFDADQIRYVVSSETTNASLLTQLYDELQLLRTDKSIATSIMIIPDTLKKFDDYLEFLEYAEELFKEYAYQGEFQIASFHPDYKFADENSYSLKHYTNRSPYPMVHLLRESDVEMARQHYPDIEKIPHRNKITLEGLGESYIKRLIENASR